MSTIIQEITERTVQRGSLLYSENDVVNEIVVIKEGHLIAMSKSGKVELKKGSVIGLIEGMYGKYIRNYVADMDTVLQVYPLYKLTFVEQFEALPLDRVQMGNLVSSVVEQVLLFIGKYNEKKAHADRFHSYIAECLKMYTKLCSAYGMPQKSINRLQEMETFQAENVYPEEYVEYFEQLMAMPEDAKKPFLSASLYMSKSMLQQAISLMEDLEDLMEDTDVYVQNHQNYIVGEEPDTLFALFEDLILQLIRKKSNITVLQKKAEEILNFAGTFQSIDRGVIKRTRENYLKKLELYRNLDDSELGEASAAEMEAVGEYTEAQLELVRAQTEHAAEKIIAYAGLPEEKNELLRKHLTAYTNLEDKMATTDEVRRMRKKLTELFYDYYEAVFFKYHDSNDKNELMEMFLDYGFMDDRLVPEKMIADLYYLKYEEYEGNYPIFTMKEWLEEIYEGREEPSRNEFELDYEGNLREMKKTQNITPEEEKAYRADQKGKVSFELKNMLSSANRLTQGQILTFCPVLHAEEDEDSLAKLLLQKVEMAETLDKLVEIDFSCFYRQIVFWDVEHGIKKELIDKKVYPNIILMPNVGVNGVMWQEGAGPRKDTPARFAFPMFTREDLTKMAIPVLGHYRWEICRNIQGVYWNDLQEKSLTSEYFDYAQFFKKNRDLSTQAKDRVKQQLVKAKNSFKNMFVQDYTDWVLYESNGSSRLNKVSKEILAAYCPFAVQYRNKLAQNPSYTAGIERYERIRRDKKKRADSMENTLIKNKGTITEDLQDYFNYLDM